MPVLTPFSHDEFLAAVRAIAADVCASGWLPDLVVGVGRGGLPPACYLSHALDRPMVSLDLSAGLADLASERLAALSRLAAAGTTLLVVDDINDSGNTISGLRQALPARDAVRFAVLIDNHRSVSRVDYAARTIGRAATPDWFVFPWEALGPAQVVASEAEAGRPRPA